MKRIISITFAAALLLSGSAIAGDAAAGKTAYMAKGCVGCHGAGGVSVVPIYPALKGKKSGFIATNLTDFRSGTRANPTMNAMAAGLSDSDIANLAAYIGSL
ncbi:MAG: cytochrome c [Gammaproteobacteria bacterium]|nr:cytochrome c [Gammaproteobacteria bacterium]